MIKKDIIGRVSKKTGIKNVFVKQIVDEVFNQMFSALKQRDKVEIRNFGNFKVKKRKPRIARDLQTNLSIPVAERDTVVFIPGLKMKQQIK